MSFYLHQIVSRRHQSTQWIGFWGFFNFLFIYSLILFYFFYFWLRWVFVAVRGLFSGCGEQGLLFVAVLGLLITVASFVVEHWLYACGLQ